MAAEGKETTAESASPAALARGLLAAGGPAALATLSADGSPFASYVVTAKGPDGSPLMMLSRLAVHTQNIERDPRASLLFVRQPNGGEEAMTAMRLTVMGRCAKDEKSESRACFVRQHPDASRYADFADFAVYRLDVEGGHLVAGFGRIVALSAADLLG
jgi:putative heme iron utilization protein